MNTFWEQLLRIDGGDEDTRRRGRSLAILALGLVALCLASLPLVLLEEVSPAVLAIEVVAVLLYTGVYLLARRRLVAVGAWLLVIVILLALLGSMVAIPRISIAPFYLVLPVLAASLTLRPRQIWLVSAVALIGMLAALRSLPLDPLQDEIGFQIVIGGASITCLVALMGFLGAQSTTMALGAAEQARAEAEQAAGELARAKAELEQIVAERTAALKTALSEARAHADEQSRLLEEVDQQRMTIRELSVPVIPISSTTLIMPLVGALDSTRLQQIQEQALQALQGSNARYLIMDITGVPIVDTQVAQGLLAVVQAARLLGAQVMMVGIRPEVAQAIVGLGLNLRDIYTASNLESALKDIALN
jgi:rsbT co-antagonist protein RsbR